MFLNLSAIASGLSQYEYNEWDSDLWSCNNNSAQTFLENRLLVLWKCFHQSIKYGCNMGQKKDKKVFKTENCHLKSAGRKD